MRHGVGLWAASALLSLGVEGRTEAEVYELKPVEVEAWHFGLDGRQVPADVIRLDSGELSAWGAGSVAELLQSAANVQVRSVTGSGGGGELGLRGFGENSGLRVLVLVDGVRVNRPDMGGLEWQQLPVAEIESVEVIRGGQTVLYGSHAVSGVVKLQTRKGGTTRRIVQGSLGTEGMEQAHVAASGSAGRGYYRIGAQTSRDAGQRDNSLTWSRFAQGSVGMAFRETDDASLRVSVTDHYVQFPGPLTWEQYEEDPERSTNGGEQFSRSRTWRGSARWQGQREWGQAEVYAGSTASTLSWDLDGTVAENRQRRWNLAPKVRVGDAERFLLLTGDFYYDELEFTDYLNRERAIVEARADLARLTAGGAVFGQLPVGESLSLSGGLRGEYAVTDYLYEKYDPIQINPLDPVIWDPMRPNPNYKDPPDILAEASADERVDQEGLAAELSLNWEHSPNLRAWGGFDRVYRYPVLDEVAAYQGFPLDNPVNTELEPEEGNQWELGWQWQRGGWKGVATAFHLRMENEITFDDDLNLNTNLGPTERNGLEAALSYGGSAFGWRTRWSLVEARLKTADLEGKTVPLAPDIHGNIVLWVRPHEQFLAELDIHITGRRYQGGDTANEQRVLQPYALAGLRLRWEISGRQSLTLRVRNILDTDHVSTAFNGGYYPGSGRRLDLSARMEF